MADISTDKIKELLRNPENINLIAGIASSMSGKKDTDTLPGMTEETPQSFTEKKENALLSDDSIQASNLSLPPEISSIAAGLMGSASKDNRVALLNAIKPYVSDSKKERLDGLVKAISVAGIINGYKNFF